LRRWSSLRLALRGVALRPRTSRTFPVTLQRVVVFFRVAFFLLMIFSVPQAYTPHEYPHKGVFK
jgi:hypothetical protein